MMQAVQQHRPFHYGLEDSTGLITVPANRGLRAPIRVRSDAGFVWTSLRIIATDLANLTVRVIDESSNREFSDAPINASLISGSVDATGRQMPYQLPVPTVLDPNETISFDFADLSGVANVVGLVMSGYKLSRPMRPPSRTVFWHRFQLVIPAGVGNRDEAIIPVQNNADFTLTELSADVTADWNAEILSASGSVPMQQFPIPAELLFGNGQRPGALAAEREFAGAVSGEDIIVRGTNRGAGGINVDGVLGGFKEWNRG